MYRLSNGVRMMSGMKSAAFLGRTSRAHYYSGWRRKMAVAGGGGAVLFHQYDTHSLYSLRYTSSEPKKNHNNKNDTDSSKRQKIFDLTQEWQQATAQGKAFFQKWIVTRDDDANITKDEKITTSSTKKDDNNETSFEMKLPKFLQGLFQEEESDAKQQQRQAGIHDRTTNEQQQETSSVTSILKNVSKVLLGSGNANDQSAAMQDLIEQARKSSYSEKGDVQDSTSFLEILNIMNQYYQQLDETLQSAFGHLDFSRLFPTSMYYYMELEDEIKNPSWKCRMHRFHSGVDIDQVQDLVSALYLAELSYASSVEEIQQGLQYTKHPVELVYCDTESTPKEPAHYILLKKEQSRWSNTLEVVMVVRGTRTVSDALTDAFLEATDYRGGKAHQGILESGQFLVRHHTALLETLCQLANKRKIKLTLIGHSMGAGCAAIAGIEWNDHPMISAKVIGFGCPSLLSQDLAKQTKSYITTVVADADMIPRMNAITIANKLSDIMEYNWIPKAERDIRHALQEAQRVAPALFQDATVESITTSAHSWLETYIQPTIQTPTLHNHRDEPILYPPGTCIHFYRNGAGISATYTPLSFFNEIDICRTMVQDHLIDDGYRRIFLEVMRQYTRDHHFAFEEDEYWKCRKDKQ